MKGITPSLYFELSRLAAITNLRESSSSHIASLVMSLGCSVGSFRYLNIPFVNMVLPFCRHSSRMASATFTNFWSVSFLLSWLEESTGMVSSPSGPDRRLRGRPHASLIASSVSGCVA